MKKFEYKTIRLTKIYDFETEFPKLLNDLGKNGWEAVNMSVLGGVESHHLLVLMKREID